MKHQIYITYGKGNKFKLDIIKLNLILKDRAGKPVCAWWGSPINAKFGWKEYCQDKENERYFAPYNTIYWRLKDGAKILKINGLKDLKWCESKNYIYRDISYDFVCYKWNFEALVHHGYAAIQLFDRCLGHRFGDIDSIAGIMYLWDCESIVVLDPTKIIQVQLNKKGRKIL